MKKSVNRIVRGLTAVVMMGTLAVCSGGQGKIEAAVPSGSKAAENTESTAQQGETQAETKTTVIWRASDGQFQSEFRIIIQDEAEKLGSIIPDMQNTVSDVSTTNSKSEVTLSKKADMVTMYAPDRESIENMMKKCGVDGVPAISFNMEPMEDTMKRYNNIQYVGVQAKQSGEICVQALINYWNDKKDITDKNGDGKPQLVILQGEIGQQDVTLRMDTYKETLRKNGIDYKILACDTANQNQARALNKVSAWTTVYGVDGIEGALCNNDSMAMNAVQTCINNGYSPGDAKRLIPIVDTDVNIDALEAVRTGSLLGTVLNDRGSQSDTIINMIRAVHVGTEITGGVVGVGCTVDGKYVWVPYVIVDRSNLGAALEDMLAVAQSE